MLGACGRGSAPPPAPNGNGGITNSAAALPAASPTTTPFAYSWRIAGEGKINGAENMFKASNLDADTKPALGQYDGDLRSTDPGARPGGGGQGPVGNKIDNISCDTTMPNTYHVHAFVGVYVNGVEYAVPDAVGMDRASGDRYDKYSGWPNQELYAICFYHVHTHDASGMVHLEASNAVPITSSIFSLGTMLDIWGVKVTASQFGPYLGTVVAYTSLNSAQVPCHTVASCEVGANQYKLWNGPIAEMPLYSHEAIWIEVGSGNPDAAHLPGVSFATSQ